MAKHVIKALTLDVGCTIIYESGCVGREPSDAFINALNALQTYFKSIGYVIDIKNLMNVIKSWNSFSSSYFSDEVEVWSKLKIMYIFCNLNINVPYDHIEEAYRKYVDALVRVTKLYEDVIEFLKFAKNKGLKLGIISNVSSHDFLITLLKYHNVINFFDTIVSSQLIGFKKPDKRIFLITAHLLGVNPENILHIGDADSDINGAKQAGYYDAIELARHRECKYDLCFKDLYSLKKYIRNILQG